MIFLAETFQKILLFFIPVVSKHNVAKDKMFRNRKWLSQKYKMPRILHPRFKNKTTHWKIDKNGIVHEEITS